MSVSRRALLLSAGAAALEATLPFRRSFAASEIQEYRLTVMAATVLIKQHYVADIAGGLIFAFGGYLLSGLLTAAASRYSRTSTPTQRPNR